MQPPIFGPKPPEYVKPIRDEDTVHYALDRFRRWPPSGLLGIYDKALETFQPVSLIFEPYQPSVFFEDEMGTPYRGQEDVKKRILHYINSLEYGKRLKFLLTGPAGCGKTTLAKIITKYINDRRAQIGDQPGDYFEIMPGQIENRVVLDAFMKNLKPNDNVFIDEVHALTGVENLFHTLDDTGLPRYPLSTGNWVDVPPSVTWIAATTDPGELDKLTGGALRRRFEPELRLDPPGRDVLAQIILDQDMFVHSDAAYEAAERSNGLPWQALLIYGEAKAIARSEGMDRIDPHHMHEAFRLMGFDEHGLNKEAREILRILMQTPRTLRSGEIVYTMSQEALCAATGIDTLTYKKRIQPLLMRKGLLTTRGGQSLLPRALDIYGYLMDE